MEKNNIKKKNYKILIYNAMIFVLFTLLMPIVKAENNYDNICANESVLESMRIISIVIKVCVWIIPLIIIVLGMVDFTKAIVADDEKGINTASKNLIRRIIAGVVVFFTPTIILGILNALGTDTTHGIHTKEDINFGACTACLLDTDVCDELLEIFIGEGTPM